MTAAAAHQHPLLTAPVAGTLARLAGPNLLGMLSSTAVSIAETAYIGRLGREPLAAAALVLPLIMMMGMMSGGAMAGGVSSAISRALGASDVDRAETLARHGAVIAVGGGLVFTLVLSVFGAPLFHLLGGRGEILRLATLYGGVAFSVAVAVWLNNILAAVLRAGGDMVRPSTVQVCGAVLQVLVGGSLCFGWGPAPRLGLVGVALGQAVTTLLSLAAFLWLLTARDARVRLRLRGSLRREAFADILRVGLPALLSPLQTVGAILILTAIAARFGPEVLAGYGIGSRLEFLLIPVAFSVGVAALPMVGLAIGAGDVPRARRVAWTAGAMGAIGLGAVGALLALAPQFWVSVFTRDPGVLAAAGMYLRFAGPAFSFFGVNLALYFASQGAGRIGGPLLAGTLRLVVIGVGGLLLVRAGAPDWTLFALVAAGMVTAGTATAAFVALTPWGPRPTVTATAASARPAAS